MRIVDNDIDLVTNGSFAIENESFCDSLSIWQERLQKLNPFTFALVTLRCGVRQIEIKI